MFSRMDSVSESGTVSMTSGEFPNLKNQVLDDLFLAAANDPTAVRAFVTIETVDGTNQHEFGFLVNGRLMTLLHDLLQAVEDDTGSGRKP